MFKYLLARAKEARAAELEGEGGLEGGFTLIELMVVLLIIAILLAIAIPTFLGVSGSARDRSAQSNLTNALTDAIAYYQNAQTFDASSGQATAAENTECSNAVSGATCSSTAPAVNQTTAAALKTQEPSYGWTTGSCSATANSNCVSVDVVDASAQGDGQGIILATFSPNSDTCWYAVNLEANPAVPGTATSPDTMFANTSTGAGSETGVSTSGNGAGTYYAEQKNQTSGCSASTVQTDTNGWKWGTSYALAGSN